jgi:hypothetical protein
MTYVTNKPQPWRRIVGVDYLAPRYLWAMIRMAYGMSEPPWFPSPVYKARNGNP